MSQILDFPLVFWSPGPEILLQRDLEGAGVPLMRRNKEAGKEAAAKLGVVCCWFLFLSKQTREL